MQNATEVPLANARRCREALALCQSLRACFNTNAASDLECAEHLARAGLLGCVANVRINLPSMRNRALVQDMEKQLEEILEAVNTA
jgi:formiminotetrahydrofolate cyclodeaminase